MSRVKGLLRRPVVIWVLLAALATTAAPRFLHAQAGRQLTITVSFADRIQPVGGSYYVAFNVDGSILLGPQPDSSHWQYYVLLRGGRFFFGTVPAAPFRPFGFEAIRPPAPHPYGQVLPDGRALRVQVPLTTLLAAGALPARIKVNVVTVDELLRPIDALGQSAEDRFGFVTMDLLRDTYMAFADPPRDARLPAFDILGGDIQLTTP